MIRADAEIDGVDAVVSKARESAAADPVDSIYDVVSAELYEKAGRGKEVVSLLENVVALWPAGKGLAFVNGIKAALAAIQELRRSSRRGSTHAEEEDALFIG